MTSILLVAGYAIVCSIAIVFGILSFNKRTDLGKSLGLGFLGSLLLIVFHTINLLSTNPFVMKEACACEHALNAWTLAFLTNAVIIIKGDKVKSNIQIFIFGVIVVDSVVNLSNPFNEYAYSYVPMEDGPYVFTYSEPKLLFYVHCFLCMSMICIMFVCMIKKTLDSPRFYKPRYLMIALAILSVVLCYFIFIGKGFHVDYSRFAYILVVVLFYYAAFLYQPKALISDMQTFVNDNLTDAFIFYDYRGNLIRANDSARFLFGDKTLATKETFLESLDFDIYEGYSTKQIGDKIFEILYKAYYDNSSDYVACIYIFDDITESKKQIEKVHKASVKDSLTGANNRTGFIEDATSFITRRADFDAGYAMMVTGINNFKGINGLYGTRAGDGVLKHLASVFAEYSLNYPMVYGRTGDGKFSCIIPVEYVNTIVSELSHIRVKLDENIEVPVDLSHGYVVMRDASKSVEYYYELSLLALAKCKTVGVRDALEYSQSMADEQNKKQLLLSEMNEAIEKEEFFIELQPQIDLDTNNVTGAEALVRWNHPILGRIPPNDFIPLFESNGFITKLDTHVWDMAAKALRQLTDEGIYFGSVSVNVSQRDIMSIDVADELEKIVNKYEIAHSRFHVEITESDCASNKEALILTLESLREKDFLVEIDDFGSGYSSLNALVHIPFDVIKLDMGFMKQVADLEKDKVIMSSVTEMIHKLNAKAIVEGVETKENLEKANYINSDMVQGYFYSKPLPLTGFVDYVKKFN